MRADRLRALRGQGRGGGLLLRQPLRDLPSALRRPNRGGRGLRGLVVCRADGLAVAVAAAYVLRLVQHRRAAAASGRRFVVSGCGGGGGRDRRLQRADDGLGAARPPRRHAGRRPLPSRPLRARRSPRPRSALHACSRIACTHARTHTHARTLHAHARTRIARTHARAHARTLHAHVHACTHARTHIACMCTCAYAPLVGVLRLATTPARSAATPTCIH